MTSARRSRSTRDRPAKSPLSQEAVVDAALAILVAHGPEAVTMRRVATALDTGPASLYVYVDDRNELLSAMLDRVIASVALETPDPTRWRAQLRSLLSRMRIALVDHPGITAVSLDRSPTTEAVLLLSENLLGILLAGGVAPQAAAWTADTLIALTGAAARENVARRHGPDVADELRTTFAELPRDRFPLLVAHATEMVTGDSDTRFEFAVDAVIDGVLAGRG